MANLYELIMIHLDLLDYAKNLSFQILKNSEEEKVDELELIVHNRTRLISIISEVQQKIESIVNALNIREVNKSDIEIIKFWSADVQSWAKLIDEIDKKSLEDLGQARESACNEILTVSTSKKAIGGYNLSSTKK